MGNADSKINKSTAVMMVCVSIFIDLIQFLLNFIPIIGWIVIWIINLIVWLTFYIWFRARGVNFSGSKKANNLAVAFVLELIPILDALPAWTFAVVSIIGTTWAEERGVKTTSQASAGPAGALKKGGKTA